MSNDINSDYKVEGILTVKGQLSTSSHFQGNGKFITNVPGLSAENAMYRDDIMIPNGIVFFGEVRDEFSTEPTPCVTGGITFEKNILSTSESVVLSGGLLNVFGVVQTETMVGSGGQLTNVKGSVTAEPQVSDLTANSTNRGKIWYRNNGPQSPILKTVITEITSAKPNIEYDETEPDLSYIPTVSAGVTYTPDYKTYELTQPIKTFTQPMSTGFTNIEDGELWMGTGSFGPSVSTSAESISGAGYIDFNFM